MSFEDFLAADARLTILKELARQSDGRLNETLLTTVLDTFGYKRSREWVRTQLRKLEELGAVTLMQAGTVLIASITRAGMDHVERRSLLEGVAKPSPEA
ncbi:hypothetical protein FQ775_01085 [Nitratireductor mangrovi]|uniref:ArsR family transcriptional regulator n=1 Tax=Nitratireductor mangrovi TaxID=2599600 RepID=A0A5B8KTX2_9HYPH|nr:hypothetical protein [Nitratireductor mangrovi]QDY99076.1 hypothetical protein FQ775_01085 [Nitratireductor mangrovi]